MAKKFKAGNIVQTTLGDDALYLVAGQCGDWVMLKNLKKEALASFFGHPLGGRCRPSVILSVDELRKLGKPPDVSFLNGQANKVVYDGKEFFVDRTILGGIAVKLYNGPLVFWPNYRKVRVDKGGLGKFKRGEIIELHGQQYRAELIVGGELRCFSKCGAWCTIDPKRFKEISRPAAPDYAAFAPTTAPATLIIKEKIDDSALSAAKEKLRRQGFNKFRVYQLIVEALNKAESAGYLVISDSVYVPDDSKDSAAAR